jgi:hypothetical protein
MKENWEDKRIKSFTFWRFGFGVFRSITGVWTRKGVVIKNYIPWFEYLSKNKTIMLCAVVDDLHYVVFFDFGKV